MRAAEIDNRRPRRTRFIDGRSLGHGSQPIEIIIGLLLILALSPAGGSCAQKVLVSVDSTEGFAGSPLPVRVLIQIDQPIASVIVPLRYERERLFPDSVTFHGSVVSPDHRSLATYSHDSNLVRILVLPEIISPMPFIFDPGGLLATVWFSVSPFAEEGFSSIDTAYTLDSLCFDKNRIYFYPEELQASDLHGNQLYPDFRPGGVAVLPPLKRGLRAP